MSMKSLHQTQLQRGQNEVKGCNKRLDGLPTDLNSDSSDQIKKL